MKKYINALVIAAGLMTGFTSCEDKLETVPTDAVSGSVLLGNAEGTQIALNGIYRMMYSSGWSDGNTHQNFGNMSTGLVGDLLGDDMNQNEQGSGWFYFDYRHNVNSRYSSKAWRSYATWNYYYTLISNANYILAAQNDIKGTEAKVNSVIGQAYAIRAYSYFYLIRMFQQTYIGNESKPGVPLYTEPTAAGTEGKARGTVQETYDLINDDITAAIEYLKKAEPQAHPSHMDLYTAYGIKANIALTQNKWQEAADAAKAARLKPGLTLMTDKELTSGFNSVALGSVIWGAKIIGDQATVYASFGSHMDSSQDYYGKTSRKCISAWLYEQINTTDVRKKWWYGKLAANNATGTECSYNQFKFTLANSSTESDYIFMRAEEMLLVEAEALCRLGNYSGAKELMLKFGVIRDKNYEAQLNSRAESSTLTKDQYGTTTVAEPVTLLDEIILQRRIELWGETGRIFDLLRLHVGFNRDYEGSNHSQKLVSSETKQAGWKTFILTIPQSEFDGNVNISEEDQNPL